jgi:hypothetical protein
LFFESGVELQEPIVHGPVLSTVAFTVRTPSADQRGAMPASQNSSHVDPMIIATAAEKPTPGPAVNKFRISL